MSAKIFSEGSRKYIEHWQITICKNKVDVLYFNHEHKNGYDYIDKKNKTIVVHELNKLPLIYTLYEEN